MEKLGINKKSVQKSWYKFSKNPLSIIGLVVVLAIIFITIFANIIAPYPKHAGWFTDFPNAKLAPSLGHPFGTDTMGRDVLSRVMFGFRYSLMMAMVVLVLVVPTGTFLGLVAGYYNNTWLDTIIMRLTDIFVAIPSLVLAMMISSLLEPSLFNAMLAVTLLWWPWYARLVYGIACSMRNEYFVQSAEMIGASPFHILIREILPNTLAPIFTKMTLDVAWVILIGSSLSFIGLGAQPPTPDLGTMVSDGYRYMPELWWISVFPGLAIVFTILGFNLLGDGIRDMLAAEAY
jgi:peptide/nickel transport system permease protein